MCAKEFIRVIPSPHNNNLLCLFIWYKQAINQPSPFFSSSPQVGFKLPKLGSENSAVDVRQDALHLARVMRDASAMFGSEAHSAMQAACMARDVSWEGPAAQWEAWLKGL